MTPPAADTGEPVAWTVTRNGGLCCDPMNNEQSAQRIAAEYRRMDPSGEFIVQALVLAAPAPREVSEVWKMMKGYLAKFDAERDKFTPEEEQAYEAVRILLAVTKNFYLALDKNDLSG